MEKIINPIMADNNKRLKCTFYYFGQCFAHGGGVAFCDPRGCKLHKEMIIHGNGKNKNNK